jgi:hypothetical protein
LHRPELDERRTGVIEVRRIASLGLAATIALGAGAWNPAGAAGAKPKCKSTVGTMKFAPPVPKLGNQKKVVTTVSASAIKVGGCTGGGVASATATLNAKFAKPGNCTTFGNGASNSASGKVVLDWDTGQSSTVGVTLSTVPAQPTTLKITGPVSAGLFKGAKLTLTVIYTPANGGCTKTALAKANFKQTAPLVVK